MSYAIWLFLAVVFVVTIGVAVVVFWRSKTRSAVTCGDNEDRPTSSTWQRRSIYFALVSVLFTWTLLTVVGAVLFLCVSEGSDLNALWPDIMVVVGAGAVLVGVLLDQLLDNSDSSACLEKATKTSWLFEHFAVEKRTRRILIPIKRLCIAFGSIVTLFGVSVSVIGARMTDAAMQIQITALQQQIFGLEGILHDVEVHLHSLLGH